MWPGPGAALAGFLSLEQGSDLGQWVGSQGLRHVSGGDSKAQSPVKGPGTPRIGPDTQGNFATLFAKPKTNTGSCFSLRVSQLIAPPWNSTDDDDDMCVCPGRQALRKGLAWTPMV